MALVPRPLLQHRHADLEPILRPLLPEEGERVLVLRALLDVGPCTGAHYVLLRLLGLVLQRLGRVPAQPVAQEAIPIPLRLPPPLASGHDDVQFPLRLPARVLEQIAPRGSRELAAMVDCLIDGPPQHSLANAAMLTGLFSAGPSMAALLEVANALAQRLPPRAVYIGLALSVCAGRCWSLQE